MKMWNEGKLKNSSFLYQWVLLGMVLLMLGGFIAYIQFQEYHRIDKQEQDRLAIQTKIVEKNLTPQLLLADRVINGIIKDLPAWKAAQDHYKRGNHQLEVINDTLIGIRPILVIQADGTVIASSNHSLVGMNFTYREYFQTALKNPDPDILHISAPFKTVLGTYVISLFKTIPGKDGAFGGIVIVSVVPEYFSILVDSILYAPDMRASIVHGDGRLFLVAPYDVKVFGMDLATPGSFFSRHRASGKIANVFSGMNANGENRIAAQRTIQLMNPPIDKPLVVIVSRDLNALFTPWRNSLYAQCILFGVISFFSTFSLLILQSRRRDQFIEREKAEKKIKMLAFYDQLTGLPNRILLVDRLKQGLTASTRSNKYGAILFIDLDHFKTLNDTLGHDMGDLLLQQVAQRLGSCIRAGDTVARLGGDEFVVQLADLGTNEQEAAAHVEIVGNKILAELNQTYLLNDTPFRSTPSIGATLFKGQLNTVDDLLKQADLAMYKSKAVGRNALRFYDPAMETAMLERAALEADLREAVQQNQFLLHYQAQVVSDGRVTGAEVLVRWQHPLRGLVSPAEFIPLAEDTGLILPLGQWVLETACSQLAVWATLPDMAHMTIAVNVSAHQFSQADFVAKVLSVLKSTGANPERLKLELTESLLIANVDEVIEKMFMLKAKGVGFSLDDFGTGYSSLAYLKRLPLDQLKIDQSFVRDVLDDPNDASIAQTIIVLAHGLGIGVIAEGVETAGQRDFLVNSGCHAFQGYFFSRPLPLKDFEQFALRR
jgi:diguanylate cyclase (GGDEF)-like protein